MRLDISWHSENSGQHYIPDDRDADFSTDSARSLVDRFAELAQKNRVPGAQLAICRNGETTTYEIGEIEHQSGQRVTRETAFPIGSITKSFTATLAMLLVADEDLELDAPVREYLPALRDLSGRLSLRQLLSHTSGLASGPSSEDVSAASAWRYLVDHCIGRNAVVPPGTAFSYSNMGYILVGHVIETVTGMSWWEAMESILLRPLAIAPTFVIAPEHRPPPVPLASGHSVNAALGRTRPVQQSLTAAEAPAGALALSAGALAAFGAMHAGSGRSLLPAALLEEMRRPAAGAEPFGLADGWGLGLGLFRAGSTVWFGHDGNGDGTDCHLRVDPATGCVVALTSNATTGAALWQELRGALADHGIPIGGAAGGQRPPVIAPPASCAGTYWNGDAEYLVTMDEVGRPCLTIDGDFTGRLTVYADLSFSLQDDATDQQVLDGRFLRGAAGAIDRLQFGGRLARTRSRTQTGRHAAMARTA